MCSSTARKLVSLVAVDTRLSSMSAFPPYKVLFRFCAVGKVIATSNPISRVKQCLVGAMEKVVAICNLPGEIETEARDNELSFECLLCLLHLSALLPLALLFPVCVVGNRQHL